MTGDRRISLLLRVGPFALAVAVFLWAAYDGARHVLPGWQSSSSTTAATEDAQAAGVDLGYDVPKVIDAHLFGTAPVRDQQPEVAEAPETRLQINLMGLIASANGNLARAIIAVGGSGVKPYSIGQSIEGTDASVHSVEARRVLLRRSDAIESLSLKRKNIDRSTEAAEPAATSNAEDTIVAPSQAGGDIQGNAIRERASNTRMNAAF